ncbi:MAG TPA: hypothetical protein PKB12_00405 [Elusimicrobiota bacterium]|jgi:hypothetical protein|nr:hypothetical protein [Elusimicrobiota bacterium]HMU95338.1 hypothetical protein [Elusimicrobiota bacterium]HMX42159.1 hypothetical protein [Elusimicrobiota bacterium]HMX94925.1 hypothetical protein [Elusimicrobiota bacterium]HNA59771.1 hypothetical protein [Elusimicrobiota bacterium]
MIQEKGGAFPVRDIPGATHPRWRSLVTGEIHLPLEFLATKILLIRAKMETTLNKAPEVVPALCQEVYELHAKNLTNPKVQSDLRLIFHP